jgi:hypothetical protein
MNTMQQSLPAPTRRTWVCAILTLITVATVAFWATRMDGESSQIAAMLGASIAVTAAAASGRGSCRPAFSTRGRRSADR